VVVTTDNAPTGPSQRKRVVIACQGGGSHTAFTAGVLRRLLDGPEIDAYDLVGLSGTSGGAICALLAWTALRDGDRHRARALLDGFWADNSASTPVEEAANAWLMWTATLQSTGWLPTVSPYDLPVDGLGQFRDLLKRHVDFDAITVDPSAPLLVVGAVDVLTGRFRAFYSCREQITPDMILASAAIPNIFPAVHTGGGTYWDGLFSQNPPVHELLDATPDELWVIQINPTARAEEPKTVLDIADRRNELAGNLSLYQELHGIEVIDRLLADGVLVGSPYRHITVRVLEFARPASSRLLGPTSKLNRDARFLRALMAQGEQQAEEFLTTLAFERAWRADDIDAVLANLAPDVELVAAPPFQVGDGSAHAQVAELCRGVAMDLTRKQLTRDRAVWDVRVAEGRGRIEAQIVDGQVTRLRLGPLS
jgi:NTE family protein